MSLIDPVFKCTIHYLLDIPLGGRAVIWVYLLPINFQSLEEFNLFDAYTSVKSELNNQKSVSRHWNHLAPP